MVVVHTEIINGVANEHYTFGNSVNKSHKEYQIVLPLSSPSGKSPTDESQMCHLFALVILTERKWHVISTGKIFYSFRMFTTGRACLPHTGTTNKRHDTRESSSHKQTSLEINRRKVTASCQHSITNVVAINIITAHAKVSSRSGTQRENKVLKPPCMTRRRSGEVRHGRRGKGNITMLSYIESRCGYSTFHETWQHGRQKVLLHDTNCNENGNHYLLQFKYYKLKTDKMELCGLNWSDSR